MDSRRAVPITGIVLGVLAVLVGLALVVGYVVEAIILRVGEPDQSRIFWYLPLLFAGVIAAVIGAVALLLSRRRLRKLASRHIEPADGADAPARTVD